jgi:hypothetical protein
LTALRALNFRPKGCDDLQQLRRVPALHYILRQTKE